MKKRRRMRKNGLTRREFLQASGAAAGAGALGMLPGCCSPLLSDPALSQFDYIVVLMMENRSFDNLVGYCYDPATLPPGKSFDGVIGKNLSNPIPPDADQAERGVVAFEPGFVYDNPNPDPGEPYPNVNTQLFNTVIPASNRGLPTASLSPPYNLPDPVPAVPPMNGFVNDYIGAFTLERGRPPTYDEYRIIMQGYQPASLPVTNTLAQQFAVCDHWHCAVPSQTFCNRSFFNSGQSGGFVVNEPYPKWLSQNPATTIFNRIQDANICDLDWGVYFDSEDLISLTGLIHYQALKPILNPRFRSMGSFYADVRAGLLPRYTFVEPRLFLNHNDMHPPAALFGDFIPPSSLLPGEVLINDIYNAIRQSNSANGNNFRNTLFIVTFDEHGGCYDHAPPPAGVPPYDDASPGEMDFRFDRLGARIPTILISAFIEPGTIINTPLEHNSVMRTICQKWRLGSLTNRDAAATDLGFVFNRSSPRPQSEWPEITPLPVPPYGDDETAGNRPLNGLQRAVVGMVAGLNGEDATAPELTTVNEALAFMRETLTQQGWKPVS